MDLLPWMDKWQMLPPPGGTVLCAVSGGRDSLCLLHYLHAALPLRGCRVAAGHLNHQMRRQGETDEAFVREFCRRRDIPFYAQSTPVYEMAEEWGLSVEEAGRRARYEFLERTAAAIGAQRIATAHHANDNAETVLLNLLRGSGAEGLGGIPPVRGCFIRPLLQTTRDEIEEYCRVHHLGYVEDETNRDTHYARNRLRLTLWSQLETINPAVTAALNRTATILRSENDYLDDQAAALLPAEGTELSLSALQSAPEVLRRRMVRLLLDRLATGKKDVAAAHIDGALRLIEKGRGTLTLPDGARLYCGEGQLRCFVCRQAPPEQALLPGENRWGDYTITVSTPSASGLTVRAWCSGDRLQRGRGSRSLKRIFSDGGIPPQERELLPVFCRDGAAQEVYLPDGENHIVLPCGTEITITKDI